MYANWNLLVPKDMDKGPRQSPALKKQRIQSVTFPRCLALGGCGFSSPSSKPPPTPPDLEELAKVFSSIRKPTDITHKHLELLNVTCSYDLPLSSVIPKKYHPDEKDENSVFNQRKREIAIENQDAFDFIARRRRDVKIGLFYKFFQAVEMVELILSTVDEKPEKEKEPTSPASPRRGNSDKVVDIVGPAANRTNAKFREELMRQFVDPIAWGFNMRIYPPRYPPKILSRKSLFNVKADLFLHQQPALPMERKEGIIIGPALLLQTRNEENYTETEDVVDVVHELCGLLYLGQERQKKGMYKKTRFEAVGKEPDLGGDDLFLISCVQHHIALTHVYLTDALITFIRTGQLPPDEYQKANPEWCSCRLGRTKWQSLIDPEGRVEALRIVMAVLGWQNRKD